jgi:hypothetical protein
MISKATALKVRFEGNRFILSAPIALVWGDPFENKGQQ